MNSPLRVKLKQGRTDLPDVAYQSTPITLDIATVSFSYTIIFAVIGVTTRPTFFRQMRIRWLGTT